MTFAEELEAAVGSVAARVGASVVQVRGGWRGGSGFVLEPGYVLTNAHNIRRDPLPIVFADGRRAEGRLAGIDVDGDLAVVAVDTGDSPALEWAAAGPGLGAAVFGVAANGSGPRVTVGLVSSVARDFRGPRGRRIGGSLEHTAPLAPGSSGSPLVDAEGRLLAINTNRLGGGFYLALPADEALRRRADALRRGESAERPRLGVGLAPASETRRLRRAVGLPDRDGLLVREVEEGSPAQQGGIEVGDLLVAAGDRPISDADDLYEALAGVIAGGTLGLTVVRGVEERNVEIRFGGAESDPAEPGNQQAGPVH